VAGYVEAARAVEQLILEHAKDLATRMKTFSVHLAAIPPQQRTMPAGLDSVYAIEPAVVVSLRSRPHPRDVLFHVATKGERCVLLSSTVVTATGQFGNAKAWEAIGWFNPEEPPDKERVGEWLDRLLVSAIEAFERESFQGGAAPRTDCAVEQSLPTLSVEAVELLREAVNASGERKGMIAVEEWDVVTFRAGNHQIKLPQGDKRKEALYKYALDQLVNAGFLKQRRREGPTTVFEVTHEGYLAADQIAVRSEEA
jgi:hypothetical protein